MKKVNKQKQEQNPTTWAEILSTISNDDLDLLISASTKMQQDNPSLTPSERKVYQRWSAQLDTFTGHASGHPERV